MTSSGLPVVTVRPTVFFEGFFLPAKATVTSTVGLCASIRLSRRCQSDCPKADFPGVRKVSFTASTWLGELTFDEAASDDDQVTDGVVDLASTSSQAAAADQNPADRVLSQIKVLGDSLKPKAAHV